MIDDNAERAHLGAADDNTTNTPANTGNGPAPPTTMTAPLDMKFVDPFAHYAASEGGEAFFDGDYVKLDQDRQEFLRGQQKEPIGVTEAFVADMHQARHGSIKFKGDGGGVERHTVLIIECPELPACPACGNIVEEHDDKRCDWRSIVYLPLRSVTDPDDVVCFTGTGKGARRAVANLCRVYARAGADRKGKSPVITLNTFEFENKAGGRTTWPDFKLIGWDFFTPGVPAPEAKPVAVPITPPPPSSGGAPAMPVAPKAAKALPKRDDLDDEIPFVLAFFIVSAVAWLVAGGSTLFV
jgi:hypothetical protein